MPAARSVRRWMLAIITTLGIILLVLTLVKGVEEPVGPAEPVASNEAEGKMEEQETVSVKSLEELVDEYGHLRLIDVHNHGASDRRYNAMLSTWDRTSVDQIVLFGDVSEPSAMRTDAIAWRAYQEHPERFIPFFSGVNLLDESGLETARINLEKGYFGIGEIAAASIHSPVLANVAWKTEDPMDGILPQLYELSAEYEVPLLLHIDPPNGYAVTKLMDALTAYPDTTFIFAHANAYNQAGNVERLLEEHPNLYMDIFAGFTTVNSYDDREMASYISVMEKYPDRFMLSTDSGYGLGSEEVAIEGMYRWIDAIDDPALVRKVAYENMDRLIRHQPATNSQIAAIQAHDADRAGTLDFTQLTRVEAGRILIDLGVDDIEVK